MRRDRLRISHRAQWCGLWGYLSSFRLNDGRAIGVRCSINGEANRSLTCATSVYLGKESLVAFLPDGLSVDVVVFSYTYCGNGGITLEVRSTLHLPSHVNSALMRPMDWWQPYVDIAISSLVAPPELLRIPPSTEDCVIANLHPPIFLMYYQK